MLYDPVDVKLFVNSNIFIRFKNVANCLSELFLFIVSFSISWYEMRGFALHTTIIKTVVCVRPHMNDFFCFHKSTQRFYYYDITPICLFKLFILSTEMVL